MDTLKSSSILPQKHQIRRIVFAKSKLGIIICNHDKLPAQNICAKYLIFLTVYEFLLFPRRY